MSTFNTFLILLFVIGFSFSQVSQELLNFFKREGFIVKKKNSRVIIDLPKGKVFPGERFEVFQKGEAIIHPVTKKVLGYDEKKVGEIEITLTKDNFSVAKAIEDKGFKAGDKIKLYTGRVCYIGKDEGFYSLSQVIENLSRGTDNCDYVVKEMENGYGVSFKGKPIAFFPVSNVAFHRKETGFEYYAIKAKFVRSLEDLPLSADICKLFGKKDYLVVLFPDKLKVYEVLKTDFIEITSYSLPPGYPVGVVCYENGKENLIIVNSVSNGSASSSILKPVGDTLILAKKNIPYIFGIFVEKGKKVLIGQELGEGASWGEVYRFELEGYKLVKKERLNLPEGFRIDGAAKKDNILVFVDNERRLRVFIGEEEVLSEDGFGLSYTTAKIPGIYDYGEGDKYFFYVRPTFTKVYKELLPLVVKNKSGSVFELVGFTKFTEGELWTVIRKKEKIYDTIKLKGRKFEGAIQAIVKDSKGRIFVITGSQGTLSIQNRGEIFLIEITPL